VKKLFIFGSPFASRVHESPPFSLRQTAGAAPGHVRVIPLKRHYINRVGIARMNPNRNPKSERTHRGGVFENPLRQLSAEKALSDEAQAQRHTGTANERERARAGAAALFHVLCLRLVWRRAVGAKKMVIESSVVNEGKKT